MPSTTPNRCRQLKCLASDWAAVSSTLLDAAWPRTREKGSRNTCSHNYKQRVQNKSGNREPVPTSEPNQSEFIDCNRIIRFQCSQVALTLTLNNLCISHHAVLHIPHRTPTPAVACQRFVCFLFWILRESVSVKSLLNKFTMTCEIFGKNETVGFGA